MTTISTETLSLSDIVRPHRREREPCIDPEELVNMILEG